MLKIAWFGEKIDQKNILKILPPPSRIFRFFWKKRKVLRILWFGEKVDQKNCQTISPPPRHVRRKISASVDGGRAEGPACADPGARTPIGVSGITWIFYLLTNLTILGGIDKNEIGLIGIHTVSLSVFLRCVQTHCLGVERTLSSPFSHILSS